tara:strand:+ start:59 stop:235 length:177 start_codon:yes stop_codon:yes gene_type:complete
MTSKSNIEEKLKETKANLKYVEDRLEKAYGKNKDLRKENIELKEKLNLIPRTIIKSES